MWAHRLRAPGVFESVEVAAPKADQLRTGEVLLRTLAGGICGSDTPKFTGRTGFRVDRDGVLLPWPAGYPLHEVVGEVLASRHSEVAVGSRVVGWATGVDALAEFVVTSGAEVYEYDPALSPENAVIMQPLACVLYAVAQLPVQDADAAVLGLGPIGLLFSHVLKSTGAARIVGVDPVDRAAAAAAFGLDAALRTTSGAWAASLRNECRPDLVIEAVGHQVSTLQHAIAAAAPHGRIMYFGIPDDEVYPVDMAAVLRKNLTLSAGITHERREMLAQAGTYLAKYPELCSELISGIYPADRAQQAFDTASVAAPDRIKVVLTMS
jgi:threonine dehydrogenase-like Zn-dependent dehydrogenase